jgi:hypothetical protein
LTADLPIANQSVSLIEAATPEFFED